MGGNASRGPVFVLTLHRAGGTVLVRVLNCHPELVIWGEHVGLINRLAEIDDMVTRVAASWLRRRTKQLPNTSPFRTVG